MSKLNTMSFTCTVYVRSLYLYISMYILVSLLTSILFSASLTDLELLFTVNMTKRSEF